VEVGNNANNLMVVRSYYETLVIGSKGILRSDFIGLRMTGFNMVSRKQTVSPTPSKLKVEVSRVRKNLV
jgi:hypothetical protein